MKPWHWTTNFTCCMAILHIIQLLSFNEFSDLKTTLICSNQKTQYSWYFITSVLCFFPPLTSRLTLMVQAVGFVGQQHQTELPCYSLVVETYPIQTGQLPHQIVVKTCLKPPHSHIGLLLPWTAKELLLYPLHQTLEAANFPAKHLNCQFPPRVRQAKRVTEYQQYRKIDKHQRRRDVHPFWSKAAAKGTHSPLCFTNHDSW